MRYLDGSVSYVRSDWALGFGLVRVGAKLKWRRLRTVGDSLCSDDGTVYCPSEVQGWVPLPTWREMGGMFGVKDLTALDRRHREIAKENGITWEG